MQMRVLLVEDIPTTRKAYRRVLELEGLAVYEAGNLEEARAALRRIAFHVVCLDLGLEDSDPSNFEGKNILHEISRYGEGTKVIIVSQKGGDRAHDIAIEAYEKFGLSRWLRKGQFSVEDFVSNVVGAAESARLKALDGAASVLEVLIAGLDREAWVGQVQSLLPNGEGGLVELLNSLAQDLVPIRPHRDPDLRASIDLSQRLIVFRLWSRALGSAMLMEVRAKGVCDNRTVLDSKLVRQVEFSELLGKVLKIEADEPSNYM